jgi:hypothetical protein
MVQIAKWWKSRPKASKVLIDLATTLVEAPLPVPRSPQLLQAQMNLIRLPTSDSSGIDRLI